MNEKDDIILEYLDEVGSAEPPAVIHWNLEDRGADHVVRTTKRRLKKLRSEGLIKIVYEDGSYHRITEKGRQYLRGELDASKIC